MKPAVVLMLLLPLAACDSASTGFLSSPAQRVEVARFVFSVRVRDDRVETIRSNPVWPPPPAQRVMQAAAVAMQRVSGCPVRLDRLKGDAAIQVAPLACKDRTAPPKAAPPLFVTCEIALDAVELGPTGEVHGIACFPDP